MPTRVLVGSPIVSPGIRMIHTVVMFVNPVRGKGSRGFINHIGHISIMPGESHEGGLEVSRAAVLDILSDSHRFAILECLVDRDDQVGVAELSQMVAEKIRDQSGSDESVDVKRLRIMLYHAQLPQLAARGVVDFDPSENRVVVTTRGKRVVAYLNQIEEIPP